MIRFALLDDWPDVKSLWGRFDAGRHSDRIEGSLQQLETYFANSLTNPAIAFPLLFVDGALRGFAVIHDSIEMALNDVGALAPNKIAFIRMLHGEPGIGRKAGLAMHDWVMGWAKARGAGSLQGYCVVGFPLEAYARLWGIKPLWTLVGKAVS